MPQTIPCDSCGGEPVVALERAGRHATGAHTVCSDCKGAGVAKCWWKLSCRGVPATQLVEGHPACDGCAAALDVAMQQSECCFYCGDGTPTAVAGPERAPACERCIDTFAEIGSADTLPPPAPEDDRTEATLVELCTAVLA